MWLVPVGDLKPGLALGHPVLDAAGRVLLNAGVTLNERYLGILRERDYRAVFVRDPAAPIDAPPDEDLPFAVRVRVVDALRKAFESLERYIGQPRFATVQDMIAVCRSQGMQPLLGPRGPVADSVQAASALLQAVRGRTVLAGMPLCVPGEGGAYHGYVSTAVVAALLAERAGLHDSQVLGIAHGALLHNIGSVFLRHQVDHQSYERDLAVLGYEMLKHGGDSALLAAHCAFEQFEHIDGTGLPRGIRGSNHIERHRRVDQRGMLSLNGEICAVAKAYTDRIAGANGHAPRPAMRVREELAAYAGTRYNRAVVELLLRMLPPYPCGTEVTVSGGKHDGWSGVVDEVSPKSIDRPSIVLYRDATGAIVKPVEVDTARHAEIRLTVRAVGVRV